MDDVAVVPAAVASRAEGDESASGLHAVTDPRTAAAMAAASALRISGEAARRRVWEGTGLLRQVRGYTS
jgi:hypothetical protein